MEIFKDVYVCGDVHRNLNYLKNWIERFGISNSLIIVAGDFGIGLGSFNNELKIIEYYNSVFNESDNYVYAVRGNHDNPLFYKSFFQSENLKDIHHIKFISDYDILNVNGKNIMCCGGAVSIDREYQINNNEYDPDEIFKFKPELIDLIKVNIDYVITHTAPSITAPYNQNFSDFDDELKQELIQERLDMSDMFYYLKNKGHSLKKWYHGHFHNSMKTINENTEFIMLNINEIVGI